MKIRSATLNDIDVIIKFKIMMFEDAKLKHILADNIEELVRAEYQKLYNENKAIHFIIEKDSKIVAISGGFIKSDIPYCFYKKPIYGFIGDMYTLKEYRKNGFAKPLLAKTVKWLKEKEIDKIQLLASKDGKNMYKKFGFIQNNEVFELRLT